MGTGIFGRYSVLWLVERLYLETAHIFFNQLIPYTEVDLGRYDDEYFFDSLSRVTMTSTFSEINLKGSSS